MSVKLMTAVYDAHFPDIEFEHNGRKIKIIAPNCKSVCLAMADHANDYGEGSYPGIALLSDKTELSEHTVIAAMRALKSKGIASFVGISRLGTNNYTLNSKLIDEMALWPKRKGKTPTARISPKTKVDPVEAASTPLENPIEAASTVQLKPLHNLVEAASIEPSNVINHQCVDEQPVPALEEKKIEPDAMETFLALERLKAAQREADPIGTKTAEYPTDVQPLLREIVRLFSFAVVPERPKNRTKGGAYAQWILELRTLKKMIADANLNVSLEPITWAYQDNQKRPREISHPAALNSLVANALREHKALIDQQQRIAAQTAQARATTFAPAPADIGRM